MLIKKTDDLCRNGNNVVGSEGAILGIIIVIEHHREGFEPSLVMIANVLIAGIRRAGIATPICELMQTKEVERFREKRAAVPVIPGRRCHLQRHYIRKRIEPRNHQVKIARCEQWPIEKARVLLPVTQSPRAVIAILSAVIEREGAAIEFNRMISAALARFHEPLKNITSRHIGGVAVSAHKNPTSIPKCVSSIIVITASDFDIWRIHLANKI